MMKNTDLFKKRILPWMFIIMYQATAIVKHLFGVFIY